MKPLHRLTSILVISGAAACAGTPAEMTSAPAPTPTEPPSTVTPSTASRSCADGDLSHCVVGPCDLRAPAGSLAAGLAIELSVEPVPDALRGDVEGDSMCRLRFPTGFVPTEGITLSVALAKPSPSAAVFRYAANRPTVLSSARTEQKVVAILTADGLYGVTHDASAPRIAYELASDKSSTADFPGLLRTLSTRGFGAVFFDGNQLFVGNGDRVLVYDGIPKTPADRPRLILGAPDLDTLTGSASSAVIGSAVTAIWTDGQKLVVGAGARILVWRTMPTTSFTPADFVLGQADFASGAANAGGISASSLSGVGAIDSDGTRLVVADIGNDRFLVWDQFPTASHQPATHVIGQPTPTSNDGSIATPVYRAFGAALAPGGIYVASMYTGAFFVPDPTADNPPFSFEVVPYVHATVTRDSITSGGGIARLASGAVAILDTTASRVAFMKNPGPGTTSLDFVLGQPDFDRSVYHPTSASTPQGADGIEGSSKAFALADRGRVLVWDAPPSYSFEPASRAIGQPGFTTAEDTASYGSISDRTMADPADVAVAGSVTAVADRANNRVLLFDSAAASASGARATVVLGQADFRSFVPNVDQRSASATTLSGPSGVALDGQHLIVADTENHRVLVWNSVPTKSGKAADVVLGQADAAGHRPNRGRGDTDGDGLSDATADGLFAPTGVASDGTHLYVADRLNHRVLVWSTFPTESGKPADAVLGQPTLTANHANRGLGGLAVAPDGLNLPMGVALIDGAVFVADTENNRIVRWFGGVPTDFIGQPDGSTVSNSNVYTHGVFGYPIAQETTAASVIRPRAVAKANNRLFVSEIESNRVHVLDATTFAPVAALGQLDLHSATTNATGIDGRALSAPMGLAVSGERLLVCDSKNHRVVFHSVSAGTAGAASAVLGQPSLKWNAFNSAGPDGAARPEAFALSAGELFVAEPDRHRVVVRPAPLSAGGAATRALGQADLQSILPNGGGEASAHTLLEPRGVFADESRVIVSDTGNNRVLVFDRRSASHDAVLVLGQSAFSGSSANRGAAPAADTLSSPTGAFFDGARLYVADTGNHRVLVWNALPTKSGAPADVVLGQVDMSHAEQNRGGSATGATVASPRAVTVAASTVFVSDAGNNRLLAFPVGGSVNGANASSVLGQPTGASRVPATREDDLDHLAGPAALASDGTFLFVADQDLGRVVVFELGALGKPRGVIGRSVGLGGSLTGLAAEPTPFFTTRLYVGSGAARTIAQVESVSRLAAP